MNVSYCTTCKGRLWQLRETLPANVTMLDPGTELILLDYQSNDGLREFIDRYFSDEIDSGSLKYYYLNHPYRFTMSYAKNVAHRLATGRVLFNLDGDNLIFEGQSEELNSLTDHQFYVPKYHPDYTKEGIYGRLGYTRKLFEYMHGYDESIIGMKADDWDLEQRAFRKIKNLKKVRASTYIPAIQNTRQQKDLFVSAEDLIPVPVNYPKQWGVAEVIDYWGNVINLG